MFWSAKKETDPLLPAYDQAPEIGGHNNVQSAEIYDPQQAQQHRYETFESADVSSMNQQYLRDPPTFRHRHSEDEYKNRADEEPSSSVSRSMGRIFQTVFVFIFFAVVLGAVSSHFREDSGRLPPGGGGWSPFPSPSKPKTLKDRVNAILTSTPLIDGHNDLAIYIRGAYDNNITTKKFRSEFENDKMGLHVDLPRLRDGKAGGAFWSSFAVCPPNASYDMSDENYATSVSHTLEQIDLLRRLQAQYPKDFTSASRASRGEMLDRWHDTSALFGPISIEGLHQVPPTAPMSALRTYYALGVRMATLTWNCHNAFADACLIFNTMTSSPVVVNAPFRDVGAVTPRGKQVIREMNRLGMIVDISHTSYWTQKAVLSDSTSRAPVVFSHSSAYSLCPHPRNVRDDILDLVKKTNSLVMVNFSPDFISCVPDPDNADPDAGFSIPKTYERNNTLHQVARHVVYIGQRIGYDHVGIGSDYDGMLKTPVGLEGVDKYPDLVAELLEMGVGDEDAKKIVGGNILRVWKDVDDVAEKMAAEGVEPGLDSADGY